MVGRSVPYWPVLQPFAPSDVLRACAKRILQPVEVFPEVVIPDKLPHRSADDGTLGLAVSIWWGLDVVDPC